jgi:hypothetical protein
LRAEFPDGLPVFGVFDGAGVEVFHYGTKGAGFASFSASSRRAGRKPGDRPQGLPHELRRLLILT